jgi:hypothetical protein
MVGVSPEGPQTDPAAGGSVFYGVANQVLQTLGQGGQIPHHLRQARFDLALNRESGSLRQFVRAGLERVDDLRDFEWLQYVAPFAVLGRSKQQNLID